MVEEPAVSHTWTIDDLETATYFRDLGVESITTNRPGYLREGLRIPADIGDSTS